MRGLLGCYENFPKVIHGVARFTHSLSVVKLQQTILQAFYRLNQEKCNLDAIVRFSSSKCEVGFEFGIAEGKTFNYFDKEELDRLQKEIVKRTMPFLDFLCVVRYHIIEEEKRVPLRFDYHLFRLTFKGHSVQLQIFHERGTQRVSLEDLVAFLIWQIKYELSQRKLRQVSIRYLRTL